MSAYYDNLSECKSDNILQSLENTGVVENRGCNAILGTSPTFVNSKVIFNGNKNILFCEPGVVLSGSSILFNGNNAVAYLSTSQNEYKLSLTIFNDSVFYMGKRNYINKMMTVILSEQRHFLWVTIVYFHGESASVMRIRTSCMIVKHFTD